MVTSNTYEFGTNTQIDDLIRESFERIGIIGNEFTGLQIQSAIMSANLELTKWTGKVPLSWTRKRFMFSLYTGQPIYQLPVSITKMIDVVAVQPQFLLGGNASSSAGGSPGNCFDYSSTTGCTQVSPNGNISYDYGVGNSYSIQYVGVVPLSQSTYELIVEYSFDDVNWFPIYSAPSQIYFANQTVWFVVTNTLNARAWRIREAGGATLALQYIYFGQPTNIGTGDRYLTSLSYTEWMQIATKMNVGYPSSYFFNAQINPTLTLWPVPGPGPANGGFTNILYTAYQYVQDVTALFNQFDVPQRFYDALVSGISFRLATKFKPERATEMKELAVEAFQLAVLTDYENVTLRLQPDFTSYGKGSLMRVRNHGKYTHMRKNSPRAIARCDYSGLMVAQHSMQRQLEYRGTGLVWTGYYVSPHFADKPNPQNLTPLIIPDPVPILNARPDNEVDVIVPKILELDVSGNTNVSLTLAQFGNLQFIFTGTLTGNVTIFVPSTYNEFHVFNKTIGGFTLSIQIDGVVPSLKVLPARSLIYCDCFNLTFIPMN